MTGTKQNRPPRCPYCVSDRELRMMKVLENGRQICENCGHIIFPEDKAFWCPCPKCIEIKLSPVFGTHAVGRKTIRLKFTSRNLANSATS